LLEKAGLPAAHQADQNDSGQWAERSAQYAQAFAAESCDDWAAIFDGTDACVAAVLTSSEARFHPHMAAREMFLAPNGIVQAAHAPRFGRSVPDDP